MAILVFDSPWWFVIGKTQEDEASEVEAGGKKSKSDETEKKTKKAKKGKSKVHIILNCIITFITLPNINKLYRKN